MSLIKKLRGVIVPIITPKNNSDVDQESLAKLSRFLSDKVNGIFALGTTGEFQYLTISQKEVVIKTLSETITENVLFLVGISAKELKESLTLIKLAKRYKADAIVFTPLYGKGDLQTKIKTILRYSNLPIILYNNPPIHNQEYLSFKDIAVLSQHRKIIGIKDSSGNWEYFRKLIRFKSDTFTILQGKEEFALKSFLLGAPGIVAGYANIAPVLLQELYTLKKQTTLNKVKQLKKYIKLNHISSIAGFKKELFAKGLIQSTALFRL